MSFYLISTPTLTKNCVVSFMTCVLSANHLLPTSCYQRYDLITIYFWDFKIITNYLLLSLTKLSSYILVIHIIIFASISYRSLHSNLANQA